MNLEQQAKIIGILYHEDLYENEIAEDIGILLARILELETVLKNQFNIHQQISDCRIENTSIN